VDSSPPVLSCAYGERGKVGQIVTVSFQTSAVRAELTYEQRKLFHNAPAFKGLGLPAFSSVASSTGSTLVVLKGSTMLSVNWPGPLSKNAALVRKILLLV
jgi:hypothetical protein